MLILVLAANTAYADFPRLASLLARDDYAPKQLAFRGQRLAFSNGILVLGGMSALLIILFAGSTEALLPLYAVAVFTAFTLSQAGMVQHWRRLRGRNWLPKAIVNAPPVLPVTNRPVFEWDRQVIYELHVRGFTMTHPDIPPGIRGTFAALGHPASINHLVRLGITTVELMPSAAWVDERHLPQLNLSDHWGYNPVAFLAPDPRLAPGGWPEVRAAEAVPEPPPGL